MAVGAGRNGTGHASTHDRTAGHAHDETSGKESGWAFAAGRPRRWLHGEFEDRRGSVPDARERTELASSDCHTF
jgi:hypothetical protein